jgi:hypothetical protein
MKRLLFSINLLIFGLLTLTFFSCSSGQHAKKAAETKEEKEMLSKKIDEMAAKWNAIANWGRTITA